MASTFRDIALRQLVEDDMPFLFRLFADPERSRLWMRSRKVFDEREFHQTWAAWTAGTIGAKFIVERTGRAIGLVFEYDRSVEDGFTKATSLLLDESVGHGGGVIATTLFMDWLFQNLPLRKVYHEVYGYNAPVVRIWRKLGFAEEGVLKGDRFWDGAYWDLHIFALYRESWLELRQRFLRLLPVAPKSAAAKSARAQSPVVCEGSSNGALRVGECIPRSDFQKEVCHVT